MAKGASKISGGGGAPVQTNAPLTAYEQQEQDLIRDIVQARMRPYDPNDPGSSLTRSDAQAMVEAFAMTHPQANEDQIMDAIDSAVFILRNGTTAPATRTATPARSQAATARSTGNITLNAIQNGKDKGKYEITQKDNLGRTLYFSGMKNGQPQWVVDYSHAKRVTKATAQKYKKSWG